MTQLEIKNIASRLDDDTKTKIDDKAEELLEILKEGDLTEEEMQKMEDCIYSSLIIQEYLDGEFDLLEEDRQALLDEMEELYNEYGELLIKARIEEKLDKKKRMTLHLMQIREQLFDRKEKYRDIKKVMKNNRDQKEQLEKQTDPKNMKKIAKEAKKEKEGMQEKSDVFSSMDDYLAKDNVVDKQTSIMKKEIELAKKIENYSKQFAMDKSSSIIGDKSSNLIPEGKDIIKNTEKKNNINIPTESIKSNIEKFGKHRNINPPTL